MSDYSDNFSLFGSPAPGALDASCAVIVSDPGTLEVEVEEVDEVEVPVLAPDSPKTAGVEVLNARNAALLGALTHARETLVPLLQSVLGDHSYAKEAEPLKTLCGSLGATFTHRDAMYVLGVEHLCSYAETVFAPASGVPLSIARHDVHEAVGYRRQDLYRLEHCGQPYEFPAFSSVWEYLKRTHGTKDAQDAVENEAIEAFVREFLRRGWRGNDIEQPKWRKGRLVLELSISTETRFGGNGHELTYHSREHVNRAAATLANVMLIIDAVPLATALQGLNAYGDWARNIRSRERTALPQDSGYVTYLQKVEIEIGADVAADLMAQVSAYIAGRTDQ